MVDNQLRVKTRAMIEKEGTNVKDPERQQVPTNPETATDPQPQPQPHQQPHPQIQPHPQNLDIQGAMQTPRVELTRIDQNNMEEYVRKYSNIGLNWYVPNLLNSCVIDMIRNKIHSNPGENRILFNSTELGEFFTISCFELDLKTGQVYTYSTPAEDIGIAYQQEEFDIETLQEHFQGQSDEAELDVDELRRIPLIRKRAPIADIMEGCISLIPLPKIDDLYVKLKGYKVFSSLDLRSVYYHIGLSESAKPKSTFVLSSLGKYQFNRVPFSLAQAPAYFLKLINDLKDVTLQWVT